MVAGKGCTVMPLTCSKCARVNPDDALYCFHDGVALSNQSAASGPSQTGAQPFPHPFTFPSGKACNNFDQLALACQANWNEAITLLRNGYMEGFLSGLGRGDLAMAAREASRLADGDRGLDQFMTKLPTDVIAPPRLHVSPQEINLGLLHIGDNRHFEIHLANQGMGLLYGSLTCEDCMWLAVGEGGGATQKVFQFVGEIDLPIHVRGDHLRAGDKPMEANVVVQTNGGSARVAVRVEVPAQPFPDGPLAGATSPRQLASKAKAQPRAAVPYFEKGAVARWYKANGWSYPIQGPQAKGAAAVQQFFDALGLSKPAKVSLSEVMVGLKGNVGDAISHSLEVRSQERRPVYTSAQTDQDWIRVGTIRHHGTVAAIPLIVPAVPDLAGETLNASVTIVANGNQQFVVPVSLEVGANFDFGTLPPIAHVEETEAEPAVVHLPEERAEPGDRPKRSSSTSLFSRLGRVHVLPAVGLLLALLGVLAVDVFRNPASLIDPNQLIHLDLEPNRMRFGLTAKNVRGQPPNLLTGKANGESNNTCIRLDDSDNLFGQPPGDWAKDSQGNSLHRRSLDPTRQAYLCQWSYLGGSILVRQVVEVIPDEQTRHLDMCLIHYRIDNLDRIPHQVGLRFLLDTNVGAKDSCAFAVSGKAAMVTTLGDYTKDDIPDYVVAFEEPGARAIVHLGVHLAPIKIRPDDPPLDPLDRLVICRWPGSFVRWQWPLKAMNVAGPGDTRQRDSCVGLYWPITTMAPGTKRAMAFIYGLGNPAGSWAGDSKLMVSWSRTIRPGNTFTIMAHVKGAAKGQKVRLELPPGMTLAKGSSNEETIPDGTDPAVVSWRVHAAGDVARGVHEVTVISGSTRVQAPIRVLAGGLFD
jgi:hypothetical protein